MTVKWKSSENFKDVDLLIVSCIVLLIIVTMSGVFSFSTEKGYYVTNQYGDSIKIFGNGIYKYDSFFKAPIFIGSDATMLILVVPLLTISFIQNIKKRTITTKLKLTALMGTVLYYATSIAFGVTYNSFHLLYIALFGCSFFAFICLVRGIDEKKLRDIHTSILPTKGISIFLVCSGIALFVAWLPDIISSLLNHRSLELIEVYTTEITYVLDIGIISPLMLLCLYLLKRKNGLGDIILTVLLRLCSIIGIMLPIQTLFQLLAGIELPVPVLISKMGIFVVLACFAVYFERYYYKGIHAEDYEFTQEGGRNEADLYIQESYK
ncbi:hypothetical protein SAMN04488542_10392 [Fontibacillus panacisegetis]|uniref:Uncharacterized protein n=1 Tax=Fontibacillus panacisegetis TaxID=670482 RepID=A0A1G7GK83_9BACL|nr:hypothetical protein [Fontibacillus panacisegetis]SDE88540.1 hypothetical protein SAMN04488542_10392 [Fontibacillus panacisegetis]